MTAENFVRDMCRRRPNFRWHALILVGFVTSCQSPLNLPSGADAYKVFTPVAAEGRPEQYRLGPSDTLSVQVFNEPELSFANLKVDTSGDLNMPLIGRVPAAGLTTTELADEIRNRLRGGYLVNPQVTINVIDTVSQKVTVEGEVVQPGVYQITGPTTLLDAVAMARGTTRTAVTDEVAIFRIVNGKEYAAKFDLKAIRRGEAANPSLEGNDMVVVGFNRLSGAWRDFLQAAPVFNVFANISGF